MYESTEKEEEVNPEIVIQFLEPGLQMSKAYNFPQSSSSLMWENTLHFLGPCKLFLSFHFCPYKSRYAKIMQIHVKFYHCLEMPLSFWEMTYLWTLRYTLAIWLASWKLH